MATNAPDRRDTHRFNVAMAIRRWFLILATPVLLVLTIFAVLQWRNWWRMLMP